MSLGLVPYLADDLDFLHGWANVGTKVCEGVLSLYLRMMLAREQVFLGLHNES